MSDYIWLSAAVCLFIYLFTAAQKLANVLFASESLCRDLLYPKRFTFQSSSLLLKPALGRISPLMFGGTDFGKFLYGYLKSSVCWA